VRLINDSDHDAAVDLSIDGISAFAFSLTHLAGPMAPSLQPSALPAAALTQQAVAAAPAPPLAAPAQSPAPSVEAAKPAEAPKPASPEVPKAAGTDAVKPAAVQPAKAPAVVAPIIHIVASGENLTGIARRYGSTISAIARANGIANPSFVRTGQRLTIPGTGAPVAVKPAAVQPAKAPAAVVAPIIHVVATGE